MTKNKFTDVFLYDVAGIRFVRRIDFSNDILDLVDEHDTTAPALVSWFQDPDVRYAVHVQLVPVFSHSFQDVLCCQQVFLRIKTEISGFGSQNWCSGETNMYRNISPKEKLILVYDFVVPGNELVPLV